MPEGRSLNPFRPVFTFQMPKKENRRCLKKDATPGKTMYSSNIENFKNYTIA
jgi:hypothetical protein